MFVFFLLHVPYIICSMNLWHILNCWSITKQVEPLPALTFCVGIFQVMRVMCWYCRCFLSYVLGHNQMWSLSSSSVINMDLLIFNEIQVMYMLQRLWRYQFIYFLQCRGRKSSFGISVDGYICFLYCWKLKVWHKIMTNRDGTRILKTGQMRSHLHFVTQICTREITCVYIYVKRRLRQI